MTNVDPFEKGYLLQSYTNGTKKLGENYLTYEYKEADHDFSVMAGHSYQELRPLEKGEADIIIIRLADLYMMRAEAKFSNGDISAALNDVNFVRTSRTAPPAVTPKPPHEMNLDILFRERGFEFYWEHQRSTDMIRFGKYEGTKTEKTNNDSKKRLFPIPQSAIDRVSDTEGYLVQNEGY